MKCKYCGGLVKWQGSLFNPSHAECVRCGAINSQEEDPNSPATTATRQSGRRIEMEVYDKKGIPIRVGDVLKVFHFVAAQRREKRYLYHYVINRNDDRLLVDHLESVVWKYSIKIDGRKLDKYEIVQGWDEFRNRERFNEKEQGQTLPRRTASPVPGDSSNVPGKSFAAQKDSETN